jgi:hypothetical protein
MSVVEGVIVVIPKWKLEIMRLKVGSKNERLQGVLLVMILSLDNSKTIMILSLDNSKNITFSPVLIPR